MKKLLAILVLGLLWGGSAYADVLLEITSYVQENGTKSNYWTHRMTLTNFKSIEAGMNKAIKDCEKRNKNKTCLIDTAMVINTAEPSKNTYYSDENQKKIDNFNSKTLNKQNIKKLEITSGYKKDDQYVGIDELTLNKLLQAAKDFREGRITESEFDRVKDDILKTL